MTPDRGIATSRRKIMNELNRTLTPLRGAALMLNIVVGAGLLALPGLVVEMAGDHALWSWLVCAVASLPLLTVFIIMGRRYPHAGWNCALCQNGFWQSRIYNRLSDFPWCGGVRVAGPIALTGWVVHCRGFLAVQQQPMQPASSSPPLPRTLYRVTLQAAFQLSSLRLSF